MNINTEQKDIIEYLKRDRTKNISILNFIEDYGYTYLKRFGASVLLRGTSDRNWVYISSSDEKELGEIAAQFLPEDKCFAIIEDWMLKEIIRDKKLKWKLSCIKLVLSDDTDIPFPISEVVPLKVEDSEYIYKNSTYKDYTPIQYIKAMISNGTSAGIYKDNKLVAWAITHDDGAIGFLHVLEEYRGRGYAKDVTRYMIRELRKKGKVPFVCIEGDNIESMSMAKKLGFEEYAKIHWFELE